MDENTHNEVERLPASAGSGALDDDHHAMMNGPRIKQSLPPEYLQGILDASRRLEMLNELARARETIANISARLEPVDITSASKPQMAMAISACRVWCDRYQNTKIGNG